MKKIRIRISADGTQRIEVDGARGDECLDFTRKLEERLGSPVGERAYKDEFELEAGAETCDDRERDG